MKNKIPCGDLSSELAYFRQKWDSHEFDSDKHSAKKWEERAAEWLAKIESGAEQSSLARVHAAVSYLRNRGLLGKDSTVVDAGCGAGLFVMEFAKTVKCAVGIDFSASFIEYANKTAKNQGITNAVFKQHDLLSIDIDETELFEAFDLVFASLSPVVKDEASLQKLMKMSRKNCCVISHVSDTGGRHNGMGFYIMLNYLLLSGYYPETYYFRLSEPQKEHAVTYGAILWNKNKEVRR